MQLRCQSQISVSALEKYTLLKIHYTLESFSQILKTGRYTIYLPNTNCFDGIDK